MYCLFPVGKSFCDIVSLFKYPIVKKEYCSCFRPIMHLFIYYIVSLAVMYYARGFKMCAIE